MGSTTATRSVSSKSKTATLARRMAAIAMSAGISSSAEPSPRATTAPNSTPTNIPVSGARSAANSGNTKLSSTRQGAASGAAITSAVTTVPIASEGSRTRKNPVMTPRTRGSTSGIRIPRGMNQSPCRDSP